MNLCTPAILLYNDLKAFDISPIRHRYTILQLNKFDHDINN